MVIRMTGANQAGGQAHASDVTANVQLVLLEREARDRGWWSQMRDCYHPDAVVMVAWFQGSAADFVDQTARQAGPGRETLHRLAPPVVHLGRDRAVLSLPAVIDSRLTVHDVEADLSVHGRGLYRTERRDGIWRISRLDWIYERDTMTPAVPGQQLRIDPALLAPLRSSYRLGAYVFGLRGLTVHQDLPGDDRPDLVATLYSEAFEWAGLGQPESIW
jgi:hypothetical protein